MNKDDQILVIAKILHENHMDNDKWDKLSKTRDWSNPYLVAQDEYLKMAKAIAPLIDPKVWYKGSNSYY